MIRWGKQLCDVLGYLHRQQPPIIYRDMKPSNVMLQPDGNVMLIDFGTAREYKTGNQEDTINIGTVGYAAPEQYGGMGQSDARTDIFCLGVTLYQLVTGQNPCEPPYLLSPIRYWNEALSPELEDIIMKCTQPDAEDRYQSCEELLADLSFEERRGYPERKKNKPGLLEKLFAGRLHRRETDRSREEMAGQAVFSQEVAAPESAYVPEDGADTELLAPLASAGVGRFVIVKSITEIHTEETI